MFTSFVAKSNNLDKQVTLYIKDYKLWARKGGGTNKKELILE